MINDDMRSRISFPGQFGILSGMTIGGIIVGSLISVIIWFIMTGTSMPMTASAIMQPKFYNVNMTIQAVSTFFLFFLPIYFFALICYQRPLQYIGFSTSVTQKQVVIVIFILLITFPLSSGIASFNKWIPIPVKWSTYFTQKEAERAAEEAALIQITSFSRYIISMIGIAFLPAVFEETFFRGGLQKLFTNWFKGPFIAIILTSIIFSLIHISYYGFLVRFALGVILGLVYYYSGSIWLNIIMHFLFNGLQVTLLYIYKQDPGKPDIETGFNPWFAVISFFLIIYLFTRFIKISDASKRQLASIADDDDFDEWTKETLK